MKRRVAVFSRFLMLAGAILLVPRIGLAGRPLVTDDARAVGEGELEIELGIGYAQPRKGGGELKLPVIGVAYGLYPGLEFGLNIQRINSDPKGSPPARGFEDFHLATKYNFIRETEKIPDLAFAFDLKFPTANRSKGLSSGRFDETFLLIATKRYFPMSIDLNLGYVVVDSPPEEKLKNRFLGGIAVRYGLSQKWRLVGEVFGLSRKAAGERNEANFQIGVRFRPELPVFFDAALGRSLRPTGTRIQGTLGVTWTFPLFR